MEDRAGIIRIGELAACIQQDADGRDLDIAAIVSATAAKCGGVKALRVARGSVRAAIVIVEGRRSRWRGQNIAGARIGAIDKRDALQEVLATQVCYGPRKIVRMQPARTFVLYVDLDVLHLGATWVLLGATDRHVELNDIPATGVAARSEVPWVLYEHMGSLHTAAAATAAGIDGADLVHGVGLVGRRVIARSGTGARHAPFDKAAFPGAGPTDQVMQQVQ